MRDRWQALLDEGCPILADGAMGTMPFAAGLQLAAVLLKSEVPAAGRRALVASDTGGNCGNGPEEMAPVIMRMAAAAPAALLVAKSNAGMPERVEMRAVYRTEPATMARQACATQEAGARIIGGRCGSTPEHVAAVAVALLPA